MDFALTFTTRTRCWHLAFTAAPSAPDPAAPRTTPNTIALSWLNALLLAAADAAGLGLPAKLLLNGALTALRHLLNKPSTVPT